jgi:alpha-ketoglutarate-dependent taurine dioxygenase
MAVETLQLSPNLGVEIVGLNLEALSERDEAAIRETFIDHSLILIRGLQPSPDDQLRVTEAIGPVSNADAIMKDGRKFTHISNQHADGRLPEGELLYHADHMFLDKPLRAISLYALEAPNVGGETIFLNAAKAYAELPDRLKQRIAGLNARHVYDYDANRGDASANSDVRSDNMDEAVHPLVWTPPSSDEPVLFLSRLFTVGIVGMEEAESKELLNELFDYMDNRGADYVHKWQPGDLIVWNNRMLQHARNDFAPTEKRALRRVPIDDAA